jgi:uncharacterized protein
MAGMNILLNRRSPMRDGIELACDVRLPDGQGPWPAVLSRTPYHRVSSSGDAARFVESGYACVVQDVRGKFDSDGRFAPLEQEAEDGHDAIDWVANQRWCDGSVALYGRSYLGIVQLPAASGGHPALKAIAPGISPVDFFSDWVRYDGCFASANMLKWPFEHATGRVKPSLSHFSWPRLWARSGRLTIASIEEELGAKLSLTRKWLEHDTLDGYWESLDQRRHYRSIRCPGLHLGGFFDHLSRGQFATFAGLTADAATAVARKGQQLVVGPWGHLSQTATAYGDWEFGSESAFDFPGEAIRFFDYHLRDIDHSVSDESPVRYFLMGENRWVDSDTWPPSHAEVKHWYLDSAGRASGPDSTGVLGEETPHGADSDSFVYDPADPAPTHGGQVFWALSEVAEVGPVDQRRILDRPDVVIYRSAPLPGPLEVVGNIELELEFSSSSPDTDLVAKLCVVGDSGSITSLTVGSIRCRYRDSRSEPKPIPGGTVVKLRIQMNHIAYTFPAGSRIALLLTSSCFPRILPHPNRYEPTAFGVEPVKARQTIHHSAMHPSRLLLPMLS